MKKLLFTLILGGALFGACTNSSSDIPLPEHPRPDFERSGFVNLNGSWDFTFDKSLGEAAQAGTAAFDLKINVPFPWGSELSGVADSADVAWYSRSIKVPAEWQGKRVFVVVGASDWETSAWLDGKELGTNRGGYTPFEFEITDIAAFGTKQQLLFKVDDSYADWHLYGKQGYGNARGIWQTVYLESRGQRFISSLHFSPDIDRSVVKVEAVLDGEAAEGSELALSFKKGECEAFSAPVCGNKASFEVPIPNQHLWTLDDPYLYEVSASLVENGQTVDEVSSYFGQRKISAMQVPGQDYKYVALNNSPIYLKLCLDQSYHPEGFYTFPSEEFMKNEILLSKKLGLNGNRIHIKVEVPRKLYWADKLGLLIMADVPNFWGEPGPEARTEWENCMRRQVERDYNHPCIFAWVDFNETWGLRTNGEYMPENQEWVRSMYKITKYLDPTRLVEDNSACNYDHVQTDINSWHNYLPAYRWEDMAADFDNNTFPGSTENFIGGNRQDGAPMINSECGNVWGYEGSAGDCDYTWDYHEMMNAFHRHPKVGGWLYTEHHDVINEWNGYVRFDRSEKFDGLGDLVPGMGIADFHSDWYIVPMGRFYKETTAGARETVELMSSFTTAADPGKMTLVTRLLGLNSLGEKVEVCEQKTAVEFKPFCLAPVAKLELEMPQEDGMYVLQMMLYDGAGKVLHRNFNVYRVRGGEAVPGTSTFAPASFTASEWSKGSTSILDGLKVDGFGQGYFEYSVDVPEGAKGGQILFEASAKQLFGKDVEDGTEVDGDFMLGHGTFDPCKNKNAYAMTDTRTWPSKLQLSVNGIDAGSFELADDPADHRGLLSWISQPEDKRLREAGSYGYLIRADIPEGAIKEGEPLVIRFSVPEGCEGGLAIYGKDFGRYPLDPTIIWK